MKDLLVVDSLNVSNKFQQHILNDISFTVHYSSITAILGKSGAGKTILARSLLDLLPESFSYSGGSVFFNQKSYLSPEENNLSGLRGRKIAIVFQEAVSYLNPVFKTGNQFLDILKTYHQLSRSELVDTINTAFNEVHLKDYQKVFNLYPHQLSSGMAQRAMLALALALAPEMLILDEPTSALDVITAGQIMELLLEIKQKKNLTILLITHDLQLAQAAADQALILKNGNLEKADIDEHSLVTKLF